MEFPRHSSWVQHQQQSVNIRMGNINKAMKIEELCEMTSHSGKLMFSTNTTFDDCQRYNCSDGYSFSLLTTSQINDLGSIINQFNSHRDKAAHRLRSWMMFEDSQFYLSDNSCQNIQMHFYSKWDLACEAGKVQHSVTTVLVQYPTQRDTLKENKWCVLIWSQYQVNIIIKSY